MSGRGGTLLSAPPRAANGPHPNLPGYEHRGQGGLAAASPADMEEMPAMPAHMPIIRLRAAKRPAGMLLDELLEAVSGELADDRVAKIVADIRPGYLGVLGLHAAHGSVGDAARHDLRRMAEIGRSGAGGRPVTRYALSGGWASGRTSAEAETDAGEPRTGGRRVTPRSRRPR